MGGVHGKIANNNENTNTTPMGPPRTRVIDEDDPRSPSLKRTPVQTPESNWRHKAVLAAANQEDPRSPSLVNRTPLGTPNLQTPATKDEDPRSPTAFNRTPLVTPPHVAAYDNKPDPVTPLTLSYDQCTRPNADDPRSPSSFRTPLATTQGIAHDGSVVNGVSSGPIMDDTVVVNKANISQEELDTTLSASSGSVSASGTISNPLADLSIISSSAEVDKEEKPQQRKSLVMSEADVEVPSSPLGASACRVEEEEEKKAPSSPSLAGDRKRKQAPRHSGQGSSPLKKSYNSTLENDENVENTVVSRNTPTASRRSTRSPTQSKAASPSIARRKGHARQPSNLKNSSGAPIPALPFE